jgi:hypothetical protein
MADECERVGTVFCHLYNQQRALHTFVDILGVWCDDGCDDKMADGHV